MAKKAYIGVSGKARKVKKGYVGIDGKARKIKKAYIGIGGVARPCWSGGELAYYGKISSLTTARMNVAATTVGNYALFGGGDPNGYVSCFNEVNAYSSSLTKSTPTALSSARSDIAATTVGNYALFGGGYWLKSEEDDEGSLMQTDVYYDTVDTYNTSLTRGAASALRLKGRKYAATSNGSYALFACGQTQPNATYTNGIHEIVTAYNASLSRSSPTNLNAARQNGMAASVGVYALFAGGYYPASGANAYKNTVDAYNTSLVRSNPTGLSAGRYLGGGTSAGHHALFAGGIAYGSTNGSATVDAYDASLTRTIPAALSQARRIPDATSVGGYALFAGGYYISGFTATYYNVVDVYDASLTKTVGTPLSTARSYMGATTVGDYALFGGGQTGVAANQGRSAVVDAYTVA